MTPNILLQNFDTPHHSAPFEQIKEEDFLPAFQELIKISEAEINEIAQNAALPTFENTIEACLLYTSDAADE